MFQQLQQRLCETGTVTAMELVSARTVLTAANGGDIIAAVGRQPLRSGGLTQELGLC